LYLNPNVSFMMDLKEHISLPYTPRFIHNCLHLVYFKIADALHVFAGHFCCNVGNGVDM
jgi:hypothetical protein